MTTDLAAVRRRTAKIGACLNTSQPLANGGMGLTLIGLLYLRLKDNLLTVIEGEGEVSEDALANERCIA